MPKKFLRNLEVSSLKVSALLDQFATLHATVIGDVMLDEYIFGRINRISQEAPVMVVRQTSTHRVPGGAANVAKNVAALGGTVTVLGVAGNDTAGTQLEEALAELGEIRSALIRDPSRITTRKTRVVANHSHQVLRIDDEVEVPIGPGTEDLLLEALNRTLKGSAVLILSDYVKGVMTPRLIQESISMAQALGIPVVANAKPFSVGQYCGATLVSLNRPETAKVTGAEPQSREHAAEQAAAIAKQYGIESVLVTLGEDGMVAAKGNQTILTPPVEVEAYDAAGAGDTVIASVGLGLASIGFRPEVFALAAQTSAKVIQHVGVAVPTPEDIASIRSLTA